MKFPESVSAVLTASPVLPRVNDRYCQVQEDDPHNLKEQI